MNSMPRKKGGNEAKEISNMSSPTSVFLPFFHADTAPNKIPNVMYTAVEEPTRRSVHFMLRINTSHTGAFFELDQPRSPCIRSTIYMMYCSKTGWVLLVKPDSGPAGIIRGKKKLSEIIMKIIII